MVPALLVFHHGGTETRRKTKSRQSNWFVGVDLIFFCGFLRASVSVVESILMPLLKLKIDVSGTTGDQAWRELNQFDQIQSAAYGPQYGSSGVANHPLDAPYRKGEWIGAEIQLQTPLLAQYAMSHYLEQERVLDADVED
jgi:hypothetical protein